MKNRRKNPGGLWSAVLFARKPFSSGRFQHPRRLRGCLLYTVPMGVFFSGSPTTVVCGGRRRKGTRNPSLFPCTTNHRSRLSPTLPGTTPARVARSGHCRAKARQWWCVVKGKEKRRAVAFNLAAAFFPSLIRVATNGARDGTPHGSRMPPFFSFLHTPLPAPQGAARAPMGRAGPARENLTVVGGGRKERIDRVVSARHR